MPEEEKKNEPMVDIDTSGPEVEVNLEEDKDLIKNISNIKVSNFKTNYDRYTILFSKSNIFHKKKEYEKSADLLNQANNLKLIDKPSNIKEVIKYDLEPSLYSFYFLDNLIDYLNSKEIEKYPCHFKINTGLNRVGFNEKESEKAINKIKNCNAIKLVSIYSHLAATDDSQESNFTISQINLFKEISSNIKSQLSYSPILHMSNTSGIYNYPDCEFDMVRAGIGLYGYNNELNKELRPVHTLKSIIAQIIEAKSGDSIGYNRAFFCEEQIRVGVIPLGHADGISRAFSKNAYVVINNKKAKVIGNICMDVFMVNLSGIKSEEGDEVIIFDKENNAEFFAKTVGTISYEILTNLSERIERKFINKN